MRGIKSTSKDYPPNHSKIISAFPTCNGRAVFAYGSTVYNPFNLKLTPDLCEHEEVHSIRQGNDPEEWWDKYISDPSFRLNEEVIAFQAQARFLRDKISKKDHRMILDKMAEALSGELYNLNIPTHKARSLISKYKENVV